MAVSSQVLIIDDDPVRCQQLKAALDFLDQSCIFYNFVDWMQSGAELPDSDNIKLIFLAQSQLPISFEKLVRDLMAIMPKTAIVMLDVWGEVDSLAESLKPHIVGSLPTSFNYHQLSTQLHSALVFSRQSEQRSNIGNLSDELFPGMAGNSLAMQKVRKAMSQVSGRDVNVMITGESGTGKEVVARNLHNYSSRSSGPFVPINCGAIPPDLLESELFGHVKGAFTGAVSGRAGRFELAKGGTLFLDEIGDMPLAMQVKLLRVLQERKFERVGDTKTQDADIRVITATHKNLEELIEQGDFREDLYYRLNVFPIDIPPLRQRIDDLPVLLEALREQIRVDNNEVVHFLPEAEEVLRKYAWPGNVRELRNLIERLSIQYPNAVVGVQELPLRLRSVEQEVTPEVEAISPLAAAAQTTTIISRLDKLPADGLDLKQHLEKIERSLIEQAVSQADGVVARAAAHLGIRRTTLVEKMRKYGIQRK